MPYRMQITDLDPDELVDFAGPNGEVFAKYLEKCQAKDNGTAVGWCWPAFFFGYLWFAYRKLYLYAIIIVVVMLAVSAIEWSLDLNIPGYLWFVLNILYGLLGKPAVLNQARKVSNDAESQNATAVLRSIYIRKNGGVSWSAMWIAAVSMAAISVAYIYYAISQMDLP